MSWPGTRDPDRVGWRVWTIATLERDNDREGTRTSTYYSEFFTDGTTLWHGALSRSTYTSRTQFYAVTLPATAIADKNLLIRGFRIPLSLAGSFSSSLAVGMYGATLVGDHIFLLIGSTSYSQEAPMNIVVFNKDTLLRAPEMDFLNLNRKGLKISPAPDGLAGNAETMWVNDKSQGKCLAFDVEPKRIRVFLVATRTGRSKKPIPPKRSRAARIARGRDGT